MQLYDWLLFWSINLCLANCLYSVQELRQDYTAIHKTAWLLLDVLSKTSGVPKGELGVRTPIDVAKFFVGARMRQNTVFSTKNTENFRGRAHSPPPSPSPEHPLPTPHPLGASTPPCWNPGYATVKTSCCFWKLYKNYIQTKTNWITKTDTTRSQAVARIADRTASQ